MTYYIYYYHLLHFPFLPFIIIYYSLHHLLHVTIWEYLLPFIPFITNGVFNNYLLFHLFRVHLLLGHFLDGSSMLNKRHVEFMKA